MKKSNISDTFLLKFFSIHGVNKSHPSALPVITDGSKALHVNCMFAHHCALFCLAADLCLSHNV